MSLSDIAEQVIAGLIVILLVSVAQYLWRRTQLRTLSLVKPEETQSELPLSGKGRLVNGLQKFLDNRVVSWIVSLFGLVMPYGYLAWAFVVPPGNERTFRLVAGAFLVGFQLASALTSYMCIRQSKRLSTRSDELVASSREIVALAMQGSVRSEGIIAAAGERLSEAKKIEAIADERLSEAKKIEAAADETLAEAERVHAAADETLAEAERVHAAADETLAEAERVRGETEKGVAETKELMSRVDQQIRYLESQHSQLEREKEAAAQRLESEESQPSATEQLQQMSLRIAFLEGQIDVLKDLKKEHDE